MTTLRDAHQQFIGHLKGRGRATATILAYGKDIEQLVSNLAAKGKEDPLIIMTVDLQEFMYIKTLQTETEKVFVDFIGQIITTLTNDQKEKLAEYLASFQQT